MGAVWLTVDQMESPSHFKAVFEHVQAQLKGVFVTVHESWIHPYKPKMKEQSKQLTFRGEHAPKVKPVPLAGMVMARIFWDSRAIIFIDYLEMCPIG